MNQCKAQIVNTFTTKDFVNGMYQIEAITESGNGSLIRIVLNK